MKTLIITILALSLTSSAFAQHLLVPPETMHVWAQAAASVEAAENMTGATCVAGPISTLQICSDAKADARVFVPAQTEEWRAKTQHVLIGAYMAACGADDSTTMYVLGARYGVEANPFFAPFTKTPWLAGAFKLGVCAATSAVMIKQHKNHPKVMTGLAIAGTALFTAVTINNSLIIKNAERR